MYKFANDSSGVSAVSAPVSGGSSPAHSAMPSPKAPLSGPTTGMAMRKLSYSFLAKAAQEVLGGSSYRQTPLAKVANLSADQLRRAYMSTGAANAALRGGIIGGLTGGVAGVVTGKEDDSPLARFGVGALSGAGLGAGLGAGVGAYHGHVLANDPKKFIHKEHTYHTEQGGAHPNPSYSEEFRSPGTFFNEPVSVIHPASIPSSSPDYRGESYANKNLSLLGRLARTAENK